MDDVGEPAMAGVPFDPNAWKFYEKPNMDVFRAATPVIGSVMGVSYASAAPMSGTSYTASQLLSETSMNK